MSPSLPLLGREREQELLGAAIARLSENEGGMCLVAGEAGAGKTMLVESVLSSTDVRALRGAAHGGAETPYGVLKAALRDHLRRTRATDPSESHLLAPGLSLVMPELAPGQPAGSVDEIPSAMRTTFERLAQERATIVFLDDLQWADAATLTVLAEWAAPLPGLPLLLIGAYRSDELPRRHPIRSLRARLRRAAGGERQVHLGPLSSEDGTLLVRRVLGDTAPPEVVAAVHRRAHGLPFYLEELAAAIAEGADDTGEIPAEEIVPESIRDAVLLRVSRLSEPARVTAEIAAAAASPVPLDVLAEVTDDERALEELLELGLLVEVPGRSGELGAARFRHALLAEALYSSIPWTARRRHHAALAHALEMRGASPAVVAAHWSRAHEPERARPLFVAAADAARGLHAYRDATDFIRRALALWPAREDEHERILLMERLGDCASRCGDTAEAIAAWQEVAVARRAAGEWRALAHLERRLAGAYELANDWPRALAARRDAAEAFGRSGLTAEAAAERLAAAAHLQSAGELSGALELVERAGSDLDTAGVVATSSSRTDAVALRARIMGLEGLVRAKLGDGAAGLELTRKALDLVLDSDLEVVTAELYYMYADVLEHATDYSAALDAWTDAFAYCRNRGLEADAHVCLACLTPALRHTGKWQQAIKVAREVLAGEDGPEAASMVAAGELGLILANQGKSTQARRHLLPAAAFARTHEVFGLEIDTSWGLARVDELGGDHDAGAQRLGELTARCLAREERHYSVAALRWASSFFARHGLHSDLGSCTDALARVAAATGTAEATGALAHALGEVALLEGEFRRAADQFERALELLSVVALPPETAETQVRAGTALAAAGERTKAIDRLTAALHTARSLGARPLVATIVRELEALGDDARRRLGRDAAAHGGVATLTPREREVLRHLASGLTNREIARELFLSTRTVDMHVRNLLAKLDCRTRTEAVRLAAELEPSNGAVPQ